VSEMIAAAPRTLTDARNAAPTTRELVTARSDANECETVTCGEFRQRPPPPGNLQPKQHGHSGADVGHVQRRGKARRVRGKRWEWGAANNRSATRR
jgi:hypothetical protein